MIKPSLSRSLEHDYLVSSYKSHMQNQMANPLQLSSRDDLESNLLLVYNIHSKRPVILGQQVFLQSMEYSLSALRQRLDFLAKCYCTL